MASDLTILSVHLSGSFGGVERKCRKAFLSWVVRSVGVAQREVFVPSGCSSLAGSAILIRPVAFSLCRNSPLMHKIFNFAEV